MYAFIKPVLEEKRLKAIYHLICLLMESSKICFVSVFPTNISVLRSFIYDAINVKKRS